MARYLITTADRRTWKHDRPVLFLGEWCRRYDAKGIWSQMDAVVAPPYGVQREQKERDNAYVYEQLVPALLREVTAALNAYHQCRHSERYWQILVGPWLQDYAAALFNRFFTVEQACSVSDVSGTTVLDAPAWCLATFDTVGFVWACSNDLWNHVLYSRIIRDRGDIPVEVDAGTLRGAKGVTEGTAGPPSDLDVRSLIFRAANTVLPFFARKHDAFILHSYLPKRVEMELQLALGQCPQLWLTPPAPTVSPDPEMRNSLSLDASRHQGFERFVRAQLFDAMPSCFLEGYRQLVELAGTMPWPKQPKFIFTSNSFAYDEVFKAYTGSMVEKGVPYFVGAHSSIGLTPYMQSDNRSPESQTSDRYFTWGWVDENPRNIPAFIFKTARRKPRPTGPHPGGLLLIEVCAPHHKFHWDTYYDFGLYQEEQFRFVEALPPEIHARLTVRLHGGYRRQQWSDEQRWADRSPTTRLETGVRNIRALVAESRLVVHSYESTGIPETIAMNVPTVCFWRDGFDHLYPSARPEYELLRRAGVFADTPEQAAAHIAQHWDDVSAWWGSAQVQEARQAFCQRFSRAEPRPVRAMKRLLEEACADTGLDGFVQPVRTP